MGSKRGPQPATVGHKMFSLLLVLPLEWLFLGVETQDRKRSSEVEDLFGGRLKTSASLQALSPASAHLQAMSTHTGDN